MRFNNKTILARNRRLLFDSRAPSPASSHQFTPAKAKSSYERGHSLVELLMVVALIGVVTSIALPQLLAQRRLTRSIGITREILTQLRETRQLAMSQRQAFTFQYDNATKQIS